MDTRSQQIAIQQSNGQTIAVNYDNQTQVVYQNQNYPPTALENGDQANGLFTVDINNSNTLTVSLPYNLSSNDINRFNSLRAGDFVRFYGTFLNNSRVELRQFY